MRRSSGPRRRRRRSEADHPARRWRAAGRGGHQEGPKTIDIVIFRFDRAEVEKALQAAVGRGVVVRALIAHTNRGGEKNLRKLELRLLECGVTVARTADDLPRYHGKMMIDRRLAAARLRLQLHEARHRQEPQLRRHDARSAAGRRRRRSCSRRTRAASPTAPAIARFVVSPENSREALTAFIRGARKQLLIYDQAISDNLIQRVLARSRAQPASRSGSSASSRSDLSGVKARKLADMRLHVRAIVRDGCERVHRQPEPAAAGAGRPPRGRGRHQGRRDRPARFRRSSSRTGRQQREEGGSPRTDSEKDGRDPDKEKEKGQGQGRESVLTQGFFRRVITPESTTSTQPGHREERQLVLVDFHQHERPVGVEALGGQRRVPSAGRRPAADPTSPPRSTGSRSAA